MTVRSGAGAHPCVPATIRHGMACAISGCGAWRSWSKAWPALTSGYIAPGVDVASQPEASTIFACSSTDTRVWSPRTDKPATSGLKTRLRWLPAVSTSAESGLIPTAVRTGRATLRATVSGTGCGKASGTLDEAAVGGTNPLPPRTSFGPGAGGRGGADVATAQATPACGLNAAPAMQPWLL